MGVSEIFDRCRLHSIAQRLARTGSANSATANHHFTFSPVREEAVSSCY